MVGFEQKYVRGHPWIEAGFGGFVVLVVLVSVLVVLVLVVLVMRGACLSSRKRRVS